MYNPQKAINEMHRILKEGGTCILSTRFMYPYHPDPKDYYRFTKDGLEYLFKEFSKVEVIHHGNKIQTIWELLSRSKGEPILNILNPLFSRINFKKTRCPCGFVVNAKK